MDITAQACNACAEKGRIDDGPHRYTMALAGGPEVHLDLCEVHDDFFQVFVQAYLEAAKDAPTRPSPAIVVAEAVAEKVILPAQPTPAIEAATSRHAARSGPTVRKNPAEYICLVCPEPLALTKSSIYDHAKSKHRMHPSDPGMKWGGTGKLPKKPTGGMWKPGVPQVICPLKHRSSSPEPYWVDVRARQSHAKHHDMDGPELPWKVPPELELTWVCDEHEICVKHAPYGFPSDESMKAHKSKAASWKKASKQPMLLAG